MAANHYVHDNKLSMRGISEISHAVKAFAQEAGFELAGISPIHEFQELARVDPKLTSTLPNW